MPAVALVSHGSLARRGAGSSPELPGRRIGRRLGTR